MPKVRPLGKPLSERGRDLTAKSLLGKQIAQKKRELREIYGGVMSPADLDRELGFRSRGGGVAWAQMVGVEAIMVSPKRKGYETDLVAEKIVRSRMAV